jgi:predicted nucleic acid-binding protein
MRFFVDTDVVVDLLVAREPFFTAAADFFYEIEEGRAKAGVAALTFSNAFHLLRKEKSAADSMNRLQTFKPLVDILAVDERCVLRSFRSGFSDYEDAIQHECALANKMDCIVTRNIKDYKLAEIPVYTPADALKVLRRSR